MGFVLIACDASDDTTVVSEPEAAPTETVMEEEAIESDEEMAETNTIGTTLQGSDVAVNVVDGEVFLNETIKVILTDIPASNGIIHVIDMVLISG